MQALGMGGERLVMGQGWRAAGCKSTAEKRLLQRRHREGAGEAPGVQRAWGELR